MEANDQLQETESFITVKKENKPTTCLSWVTWFGHMVTWFGTLKTK